MKPLFSFGLPLVCAMAFLIGGCNGARNTAVDSISAQPTGFTVKQITNTAGRTRSYGLFIPKAYTPNSKWPVIVFLHGIGEAGSDPRSAMRVGLAPFVADQQETFPFIVIFPQSTGGWSADSQAASDVISILHQVEHDYSVDTDCVSLTGLSTGGQGTFAIWARYNHEFTALAPMCPAGGDLSDGDTLAKMHIWAFENAVDPFVAPLAMASTLTAIKAAGGEPKHTVFVGVGHDCWETAYRDGQVFEWMKAQRRVGAERTAVVPPTPTPAPAAYSRPIATAPHVSVARSTPAYVPTAQTYTPKQAYIPAQTYSAPTRTPVRTSSDDSALIQTPY